jgi:hypothetical protein
MFGFIYFLFFTTSIYYFRGGPKQKSPKSKEAIPKEAIPEEVIPKEAINCFLFIESKRKQLLPLGIS